MTGGPPFQHSNPAVVISNHLTAQPPAIGDRNSPELSGLGPAFDKALAKAPADRYETCTAFAKRRWPRACRRRRTNWALPM